MASSYRPRILILSASDQEPLSVAKEVQRQLDYEYHPTLWTQGVFKAGRSAYESFSSEVDKHSYGIFVLTPDDSLISRGKEWDVPRMNVVFELGFFAARHGINRAFLLSPRGQPINYLSDLSGIQPAEFDLARFRSGEREAALGAAVSSIESAIRSDRMQYPSTVQRRENLLAKNDSQIKADTPYCLAAKLGSGHQILIHVKGFGENSSCDLSFGWLMSMTPSSVAWDHSEGIVNGSQKFWAAGPCEAFTDFRVTSACKEIVFDIFENSDANIIENENPTRSFKFKVL